MKDNTVLTFHVCFKIVLITDLSYFCLICLALGLTEISRTAGSKAGTFM